ncbi:MAG: proline--tRNA ligase [Myxococcota bacterium]
MRYSKYLVPTLKEVPADAQVVSHILMLRAGMIRKLSAGIYNYLPLALKTLRKIEAIIREEMNRAGAIELLMPAVQPAEIWQESGRWNYYGPELLRFKDRKGGDFCLGPTHEEVITDLFRNEVRSYRNLPINLYQIQAKFRDEIRPRFGLMRGREFIMKDAYSFDIDEDAAKKSYWIMYDAYTRIFTRCGLKFKAVEAGTGAIGGTLSHEFQVLAETGEDAILSCNKCSYAANIEKAETIALDIAALPPPPIDLPKPTEVATPNKRTVEEVTEFLGVSPKELVKTLIYLADGKPVAVLVRGDRELSETKLSTLIKCDELVLADDETILRLTKAPVGFAGPLGLPDSLPIYGDFEVAVVERGVVGGNKNDFHIKNVHIRRDAPARISYNDLRQASAGEVCPRCKKGVYELYRGIEVGQVFYLGTKYSERMNALIDNEKGEKHPVVMGCYGIGVGRTMAAAIEQNYDRDGIIWHPAIAPFHAIICPAGSEKEIVETALLIYNELSSLGVEVILDDRGERPGAMFKDADLLGIPIRITVGKKGLAENKVEFKLRRNKELELIPISDVAVHTKKTVDDEIAATLRKADKAVEKNK